MAWSQPEEVRIRALDVSTSEGRVRPKDLLGRRGIIIRDTLPGQFWTRLARPVGDVNGDGFADLTVFWGAVGDVVFEELYLVYGRADPPERIDRSNIARFSSRFVQGGVEFGNSFGGLPRTVPAGDVDGDGFADFFIGVRSYPPLEYRGVEADDGAQFRPGLVYLLYGGPQIPEEVDLVNPPESLRMVRFSSKKPNRTVLGEDMRTGGDLNGDGIADFVFAAGWAQSETSVPGESLGPGRVYVLFGRKGPYQGLIDLEEIGSLLPGIILEGNTNGQGFGLEVAFAGDVNGDRLDDLLIDVRRVAGSQTVPDHVVLLYGSNELPGRLSADEIIVKDYGARFLREAAAGDTRQSLAPLGDLDGDGMADFLVGSPLANGGQGAAYIVFGRAFSGVQDISTLVPSARFFGESGAPFGSALETIDYDADGILDLLMGSCWADVDGVKRVGRVYVLKGPFATGSWTLDGIRSGQLDGVLLTSEIPECLGSAVHNLGDFNGDGRTDLLIAGPYGQNSLPNYIEPGLMPDPSLYVVFGTGGEPAALKIDEVIPPVGPLEGGVEITLLGQGFDGEVEVQIGGRPAKVLRVETSARLVVEAPRGESPGPIIVTVERGADRADAEGLFRYVRPFYADVYVEDLAASGTGLVIDAGMGRAVVLDHDGDGFGDVVIDSFDGLVIVYGRRMSLDGQVITVLPGEDVAGATARLRLSDRVGHEPFVVGDVNGDGKSDLAVVSEGVVTMIFGGERFQGSLEVAALLETGRASLISTAGIPKPGAAGGADMDGDGIGDTVLYSRSQGSVHVVRGRRPWPPLRGLALEPVFRSSGFMSTSDGNLFGTSAALVGDIDGDGFSEVLIGAPGLHWLNRGNGFLVFGKRDWGSEVVERLFESKEAFQINSVKERDSLGFRVTAMGDFNGDGIADLALSAQAGSLEFSGESYVVFGGDELRGAPPLELAELGDRGVRIRGEFGYDEAVDIAPAGDFNGDGRADLLVSGGNFTTPDNPFPARSFVVFGGARGMVDLGKLGEHGFRIHAGQRAQSIGGTDFNGDAFDDVVVRGDALIYVIFGSGVEAPFIRGDSNRSGDVDISDAVTILDFLFLGTAELKCRDSADADDNGFLEITDAVYVLGYLFLGSEEPAPPFPAAGSDPTEDALGCRG